MMQITQVLLMVVSLLRTILQFELGFAFFGDDQNPYKKSVVKGHHYCLFKGASFHFFSKQKKTTTPRKSACAVSK